MNSQKQKKPTPWSLVILFILITSSVLAAGLIFYRVQKKNILSEKQVELSAIADLKIRQISQWRIERLGDGEFLGGNVLMVKEFIRFLKTPTDSILKENIYNSLKPLIENFDYRNFLLLDTAGVVRLSYPEKELAIGEHLKATLPEVIKKRKPALTDLHSVSMVSFVHLDLVIPLSFTDIKDSTVYGLMALRIDPQKILYPLIKTWPTSSRSAETLLIERDGNDVVFLNELRHFNNSDLRLRKSLSTENLIAARAVQGITGSVDGVDYRNIPVVAAMKKIPGTPWYMVSKIDLEEALEGLTSQMKMVAAIIILFIISIGLFLGFLWRNQRVRFYREKYESEHDILALVKHFNYILKYANDIIFLIDSDLTIVEANDKALETYQYSREELVGMKLQKIRSPETLIQLNEQLKYVEENESATFETFHIRKDDTVFPIEISSRLVTIEGAKYYQTIGRDITERKAVEEILRESELKFRKIFEESPFCMVMAGKDFGILRANSAFCKMIGYEEEELKEYSFKNITHPDHVLDNEISLMRLISGDIPIYHTDKRYIRKNGVFVWCSTTVSLVRNNKEEVQFFLVMVEDITSKKISEAELNKSFSLIRATLESTADGILVVDQNGMIVQFNQKFKEMWKIKDEILSSGNDSEVLSFVKDQLISPDSFLENVRQLYSEPELITSDLLEFKDGRFFERYSQPQKVNGKSVGRVWSFRDITEKKRAETELVAAKERAEESDRLKTAFLHNVSHEIRTPMNAIIGFSTLLSETDITEKERTQYVDIIFQSSNQLLSIINDIVDIANVETGQVKMNFKELNLNSSLKSLCEQFNYDEDKTGVPVIFSSGLADTESTIFVDGTKLIQVLSNLISNSRKFTKEGQIDFGYVSEDNSLRFFVKDTGIGIPEEQLCKIFDRFYQVDKAISRQFGGTGLGLSICKAYVELLGGKISVESEPGKGTIFNFTIPYSPSNSQTIITS